MTALIVGLAGMIGALLRFSLDTLFAQGGRFASGKPGHLPLATLLVNAVGSLLIGYVGGLAIHAEISPTWHTALATGLAGGLTTFSSFAVSTVVLWREGRRLVSALNVAVNLVLGLGLAWLGFWLAS
ncbi:fluoride efflux transporter CrcB [Psychromicrobium lacuslunae]|uniref:Fluoride-specific ion channel FluC n=1 Tax=Psychromicrobium lacuslunae TaxID=1618207 RepID=A0A0D4BZ48_9MICC|nr:fluoride efflux transporter CrcB [Psychromicrobium lacuslunae]AJT41391.1 camphor resistance protein CrcB [Psychromicrobium lacuslunae]